LEATRQKLASATGRMRDNLQTSLSEIQSELDLTNARRDAVRAMVQFFSGTGPNGIAGTGLRGQVEALARSLPEELTKPPDEKQKVAADSQSTRSVPITVNAKGEPTGIWDLGIDLLALHRKRAVINDSIRLTDGLVAATNEMRAPLTTRLKDLSNQGDELAKQADTANTAGLASEKKQLDELTGEFKQVTARLLPLSKLSILLGIYKRSLADWQNSVGNQYNSDLRSLLLRLGVLTVILAIVFILSSIWRRAIVHYVHDVRRKYQLLLIRKIVLWVALVVVITFSFASQLTSVATFAGLMTAGVALALQSVILSIVGYFFLIGKFGIRVGDRVQIADVTGEVVDVGLVRLHLMELGARGASPPTGRVVSFPNSIVFQASAGLFKQFPGTNFVWHEIALTFSGDSDWTAVEQRIREATDAVFKEYSSELDIQQKEMARSLATSVDALHPRIQLHFVPAGLEVVVRYPLDLQKSAEIDDRMTRSLLEAIRREPRLKLAGSEAESVELKTELIPPNAQ
jgi:small-conductance mechanosensitive channel